MARIECLIKGCTTTHPDDLLMCKEHWFKVSETTRNRVWRAYRNAGVMSKEYRDARAQAIEEASDA